MGKWTKTAGLLFLAAASVYSSQVIVEAVGNGATPGTQATAKTVVAAASPTKAAAPERIYAAPEATTDVKILDESSDPFANTPATGATTQPTTEAGGTPAPAGAAAAPATQPGEGRSVSSSEVSVSDAGTVEIHVNDANLVEVLRMLSLQSQKNIVASKEVHGTITANLYDVTVREALDAILHANGYAYREKGNFIYVYTTKEIAEIEKAERVTKTEVFRVYYTPAADAAVMIKPVLSRGLGEVAITSPAKAGIASTPTGGGGDNWANNDVLVVTDYPENLDAVRRLLTEVDRRPQQIILEATILRATLNEDNALGVDFNILGGVDLNTLNIGDTTGQMTSAGVHAHPPPEGSLDPTPQYDTNGHVSTVGTGNSFTNPIQGGLKVGFLSNSVSMFVSALEQTTDTAVLANPKVLALNKQQGEVFVGNEDGYYTTITTETTSSQSVESLKTGTRLIFRPYIGNDGYIRMEVHPEDSDGSVKANGLPSKTTTEVTSNIMVKDGRTIVIGGLFRESTQSSRNQIPILGNLPFAGMLFKNQRDRTIREEVIILLTPHIVKDDASYSQMSEEELKHAEDLRVGTRKGMMPWGRERMAQGWYEGARKEMSKKNPNRWYAKWQLDCATNLNPKFSEAIELKEQISGHIVTQADTSNIRSFVRRAMLRDVMPATMPTAEIPMTEEMATETATTQPVETQVATDENADKDLTPEMVEEVPATEEATSTTQPSVDGQSVAQDEAAQDEEMKDESTTRPTETTVEVSTEPVSSNTATETESTSATTEPRHATRTEQAPAG